MQWVVVGGAGFVGSACCRRLRQHGQTPVVVDLQAPPEHPGLAVCTDLLTEDVVLPAGRVLFAAGRSLPRPVRPWTLALDNVLATARLLPQLADREVTLLSSVEVYGSAPGPLHEDTPPRLPGGAGPLETWCDRAIDAAAEPCPPHRVVQLCSDLAELDPSGRWVYALSKAAQEIVLRRAVRPERLTVLRVANVVGRGQWRLVGRLVEAALAGSRVRLTDTVRSFLSVEELARVVAAVPGPGVFNAASGTLPLAEVARLVGAELGRTPTLLLVPPPADDSCGVVDAQRLAAAVGGLEDLRAALQRCTRELAAAPTPMFTPPLPVVLPPRPERPDVVVERIAASLWSGRLRNDRWAERLTDTLHKTLGLDAGRRVVLANSGTNALRLAVTAVVGSAATGAVAACPAYTFAATAEVLRQLGYAVRLVDVHPGTWTLDPDRLAGALADGAVRVVVAVDALGNPCDYARLVSVCRRAGVPLVADSAPALGSRHAGLPVGTQADAHAFSMSFAKVVSGGGSGGAVVVPADADLHSTENWARSAAMTEPSAIVALDNVAALEELIARRHRVAEVYDAALPGLRLIPQQVFAGNRHSFVHWVLRVDPHIGRDRLAAGLAAEGVGTKPYYDPLAGRLEAGSGPLPVTAGLHAEALALPMSSELSVDDAERVAAAVVRVLRRTPLLDAPVSDDLGSSAVPRLHAAAR